MKRSLVLVGVFCVVTFTGAFSIAGAQGVATGNFAITTNPSYPEPHDRIDAKLITGGQDRLGAALSWYVDGVEETSCKNESSCPVTVGGAGSETVLSAHLTLASGQIRKVERTIVPTRVDLVVEALTDTPVFYKGRTLPSGQSTIRAVALPFSGTAPSRLTYSWSLDGKPLPGGSQMGKDTVTFTMPFGGSGRIAVTVTDEQGRTISKKSTEIRTVDPLIVFYEDNPLRGLSRMALPKGYQLIGEEVTVRAESYFMNTGMQNSNTDISWQINGEPVNNPSDDPQTITLRSGGGAGNFRVGFFMRNLDGLLQEVRDSFMVNF